MNTVTLHPHTHISSTILHGLEEVERTRGVKVVYACESGSRAWNFASPDSDFDVRFLYLDSMAWHLSLRPRKKDTIDIPVDGLLDFHGWEVGKFLQLLASGNAAAMEWLQSPIVYRQNSVFMDAILPVAKKVFPIWKAFDHYRHMAKLNYRQSIKDEAAPKLKKYFYVLRPILAAFWVIAFEARTYRVPRYHTYPPVSFRKLVDEVFGWRGNDGAVLADPFNPGVYEVIQDLLKLKTAEVEISTIARSPTLDAFIEKCLELLHDKQFDSRIEMTIEQIDANYATIDKCIIELVLKLDSRLHVHYTF
jgi:uncharacterized protein